MTYLNFPRLTAIDPKPFQQARPYPWMNPEGLLTQEGHEQLLATLPDVSQFERRFGVKRAHGQHSHDRFTLEYQDGLPLAPPWKAFIAELQSRDYLTWLKRLFNVNSLELTLHWHYTPNGCSVSPHCDAKHKLGSHIFYFNTEKDWQESWGGETVILDDEGQFDRQSAPTFEDFKQASTSKAIGNYSLLFARKGNSWHGVKEIRCPGNQMRKVFIVVINRFSWRDRLQRMLGKSSKGY
ncbi:MAG: 2OG-Fe(II) oxygenase [Nitrospirota bacterium]|nr:2OG-Fe(II) oxygenase [Nitrospirota bacterium]MDH5587348.1 2OG-Fe(II) oxygenase [Nitrospirota bacterium]MDH5774732.1 2OG-Fe(II) oxygenase [Nitrospirota bacterium]